MSIQKSTHEEARAWCTENSLSKNEVLSTLLGGDFSAISSLAELFPKELKEAKTREHSCPFKMGGEGATEMLYHIIHELKPKKILETGVAYGWSSLAVLLAIKDLKDAHLISNDMPYMKMGNDAYVGCVIPSELHHKWTLLRYADVTGIPRALKQFKGELDLCHYDSDKTYTGRMWASPILWDALNSGGLFISDDINDNFAFRDFCHQVGKTPLIFEHENKYVGIIQKD